MIVIAMELSSKLKIGMLVVSIIISSYKASDRIPAQFDDVEKVYINAFKFKLRDINYLESVKTAAESFIYIRHIVSTFYLFKKPDVKAYSAEPYNSTAIEQIQTKLSDTVIFIEQDYERRISTSSKIERQSSYKSNSQLDNYEQLQNDIQISTMAPLPGRTPTPPNSKSSDVKIIIGVVDARFYMAHPNLRKAIAQGLSYDFIDDDTDPSIDMNDDILTFYHLYPTLSHGTKCMGRIRADGSNGCDVGVAENISLAGIRMISDENELSDTREALALSYKLNDIHVFSCSYGIKENQGFVELLSATEEALRVSVETGRECLGRIYVYPSGNGHIDNCNADGYANSIYTITVANVKRNGMLPDRKEICPCALAAAKGEGYNSTDLYDRCTDSFDGTSASTAVTAGFLGELLYINPLLSKRDIEHIIVKSSVLDGLHPSIHWQRNGAGLLFNEQIGFGLMDFTKMKYEAKNWNFVPIRHVCIIPEESKQPLTKVFGRKYTITKVVNSNGCRHDTSQYVRYLEHVQLELFLHCSNITQVQIHLISPRNTSSPILSKMNIKANNGLPTKTSNTPVRIFMSVHFWGEDPVGNWIIKVIVDADSEENECNIGVKQLLFHGTADDPRRAGSRSQNCKLNVVTKRSRQSNGNHHNENVDSDNARKVVALTLGALALVAFISVSILLKRKAAKKRQKYDALMSVGQNR